MKKGYLGLLLILITSALYAQNKYYKIGDITKSIANQIVPVNGKEIKTGKITVIDFWATWCGPCIASFPHLQQIQQKYNDKIQLIALSDEKVSVVQSYLKTVNYKLNFYNDTSKNAFNQFNIIGRPTTVVLDQENRFIWIGKSDDLESILDDVIAKKEIKVNLSHLQTYPLQYNLSNNVNETKPLFEISIKKSLPNTKYQVKVDKSPSMQASFFYKATPVSEILLDVFGMLPTRVTFNRKDLDTILLDINIKNNSPELTAGKAIHLIEQQLVSLFDIKIFRDTKSEEVIAIEIKDKDKLASFINNTEGGGFARKKDNRIEITRLSLEQLASYIESRTKRVCVFNGKDNLKYDLNISLENLTNTSEELLEKYGLQLTNQTQEIEKITIK